MVKTYKEIIKKILFNVRFYKLNAMLNRCYIIMYHMIPEKPEGFPGEVTKGDFETHIAHLARNYTIISLNEFVGKIRKRESLAGCVVITFDDGFKDNYQNAYPVLKRYNAPATIFLTTGRIEDGEAPWFIKFRHLFMKTEKSYLKFSLNDVMLDLPLATRMEKKAAATKVMLHLQKLPDSQRIEIADKLCKELAVDDSKEIEGLMLSWDEIREMSENGIDFGAHTINHPVLSRLPVGKAEEEIAQSKLIIEKKLGRQVTSFAYPFGKKDQYNEDTIKILKKLSFDCAVTTELGPTDLNADLFEVNRCFQGVVRMHDLYWEPYSLTIGSYDTDL